MTTPDSAPGTTNILASRAGDVKDRRQSSRQAVTAAGMGGMAPWLAEHFPAAHESGSQSCDEGARLTDGMSGPFGGGRSMMTGTSCASFTPSLRPAVSPHAGETLNFSQSAVPPDLVLEESPSVPCSIAMPGLILTEQGELLSHGARGLPSSPWPMRASSLNRKIARKAN